MYKIGSLKSILEKENLSFIFACTCVIIMPIYVRYIPPIMVLWGLSRILESWKNRTCYLRFKDFETWLFILFIVFYFWELIGISYSDNTKTGWNILFSRLSLVLFPFVLVIPGEKVLRNIKFLLKLFAGSTAFFILVCFFYAFYKSISFQNGILVFYQHPPEAYWISYFFGSYFAVYQHPSYLALYVILSVLISFESWFDKNLRIPGRVVWLMTGIFLLISIYFLSSRSGLLTAIILFPVYFFYKLKRKRKGVIITLSILVVLFALFPIIRSNERVKIGLNAISEGSLKQKAIQDGRVIIWRSALRIIKDNLIFGVGIGDVKTEMKKEYLRVGDQELIVKYYNVHNQFLEVLVENGIIGLIFFLALMGYMLRIAIYEKNFIYGLFLIIILVFCTV
jgi:O-antigen ligase